MIGMIDGNIVAVERNFLVVDVGGVGYLVHVVPDLIVSKKSGERVRLWTHQAIRQDNQSLFGFATREELHYFELLISVPGIGPKSALAILSLTGPDILRRAIASGDTAYLIKIAGIGRKSAEKIVVHLKDKITAGDGADIKIEDGSEDVIEALEALGYSAKEVREVARHLSGKGGDAKEKIKEGLKLLSRR